VGGENILCMFC